MLEATQRKWLHGTSRENANQVLKSPTPRLSPGMDSIYKQDVPRQNAVYITTDPTIAKWYATQIGGGVVLEVIVDNPNNLMPDEDDVFQACQDGVVVGNKAIAQKIRQAFLQFYNEQIAEAGYPPFGTFEQAWATFSEQFDEGDSGPAEMMKDLVDHIVAKDRGLANAIIAAGFKAAHVGVVRVAGIYKGK